ncbi:MAG: DUF2207 domain-containing protein, partial [Mycobacterium sp.]|nr:DUF2207 domain-containing protein [Mycobacterium sp.]
MKSLVRRLALLIPIVMISFGLLWPAIGDSSGDGAVSDPVVFSEYRADFAVDADGLMRATETITAEFPSGRHGIFRYWDVANPNNPKIRQIPEITAITLDGRAVPYTLMWEDDRFRVAKIGDPDSYLARGTHVYRISYTVPDVLDPAGLGSDKSFATSTGEPGGQSTFYWNVIAPAWNNEIERADITVTFPGTVPGAGCSVGRGVGRPCEGLTVAGDTVRLYAKDLAPRTPVTLRAGVDVPTPARTELPWTVRWDGVLGYSVPVVLWLIGLTAAAGLGAFLWWRTTVEPPPGFPLQYAPPKGLGPVQCEYIRTERVPAHGVTATLFHLADRGLLSLNQSGPKKWTVHAVGDSGAWADVDPVSVAVGSALGLTRQGAKFSANGGVSAGKKLTSAKQAMETGVKLWARDEGLVVRHGIELWLRFANIVALLLAFSAFLRLLFPITLWGAPFAAFFLLSLPAWRPGVGMRRTAAGRQLWSETGGFHRMLATNSAESRFDFSARKDLYTAYIPFAVAGGAAAAWAAKYRAETGQPPPEPGWYHASSGTAWASFGSTGANFDSFESALSSSIG